MSGRMKLTPSQERALTAIVAAGEGGIWEHAGWDSYQPLLHKVSVRRLIAAGLVEQRGSMLYATELGRAR